MQSPAQPATVDVLIAHAIAQARPSAWHIDYEVRNAGPATVWLVDGERLVLGLAPGQIELSYARAALQPGVQVFGYFNPACVPLTPGAQLSRQAVVEWPCSLSLLWNASGVAAPLPGDYMVSVRVGFGDTAAPDALQDGDSVEAAVLRWQRTAASTPVPLAIAQYDRPVPGEQAGVP